MDNELDVDKVMGDWFVVGGMASSYTTKAFCIPLSLSRNSTHVKLNWQVDENSATVPNVSFKIQKSSLWIQKDGPLVVRLVKYRNDHLIMVLPELTWTGRKPETRVLLLSRVKHASPDPLIVISMQEALQKADVWISVYSWYLCHNNFN
ncbi:uncharacterized protein [Anabrus simplex]|uniref:uncharacterized protein n=1 Tax=Anabrus simplex TaxID=316456 RepID=UPI0035A2E1DE